MPAENDGNAAFVADGRADSTTKIDSYSSLAAALGGSSVTANTEGFPLETGLASLVTGASTSAVSGRGSFRSEMIAASSNGFYAHRNVSSFTDLETVGALQLQQQQQQQKRDEPRPEKETTKPASRSSRRIKEKEPTAARDETTAPVTRKRTPPKSRGASPARGHSATQTTGNRKRSSSNGGSGTAASSSSGLRRGKWTVEEETYVARVIQDFNSGFLDAPAGTTLRTYLSEKLQCDPMRITKKFTGESCIGKRVFHPAVKTCSNSAAIDKAQVELEALEQRWRQRLELQQSESAKKAAASAAAVAAAATGGRGSCCMGSCPPNNCSCAPTLVRAAGWLERAKSSLQGGENDLSHLSREEIVQQMEQVQRLLKEPPATPSLSSSSSSLNPPPQVVVTNISASSSSRNEKTAKTASNPESSSNNKKRLRSEEAEDAEALVNFLHSVQAAAAASHDTI